MYRAHVWPPNNSTVTFYWFRFHNFMRYDKNIAKEYVFRFFKEKKSNDLN